MEGVGPTLTTLLVVVVILVIGTKHYRDWQQSGDLRSRRKTFAWAWAFIGAIIGSFVGVAGFGGAIIGTIPGAVMGWLFGSNLNKPDHGSSERDINEREKKRFKVTFDFLDRQNHSRNSEVRHCQDGSNGSSKEMSDGVYSFLWIGILAFAFFLLFMLPSLL